MSVTSVTAELVQLEKRAAVLKKKLQAERSKEFTELPAKLGLKSIDGLIAELAPHASSGLRAHLRSYFATVDLSAERIVRPVIQQRGGRISRDAKARIEADLQAGLKSSRLIAVENGVSAQTVQNIKRALGLTKSYSRRDGNGNGAAAA